MLLTLGHTNVPYPLCEHDWCGLRFGLCAEQVLVMVWGYDKASLGVAEGRFDLCVVSLFEVPAAVVEEPFDVG